MSTPLLVHGLSDPGRQHATNEDTWAQSTLGTARLLVLCDGMGGMGRGAQASQMATGQIMRFASDSELTPKSRLKRAIEVADEEVRSAMCTADSKPGCTAVAVYVQSNEASVAWVGDSRAYWIRDSVVLARTTDHKVVQGMVDRGELTAEQARQSRYSNVLSRSVGGRLPDAPVVEVDVLADTWSLQTGDRILLCSDGVVDLIGDEEIPNLIQDLSPSDAAKQLVDLANRRGGHDNITAVIGVWGGDTTFVQAPFSPMDTSDQATEGFAPARGSTPLPAHLEEEDEDDKATVLANPTHDYLQAALVPPTPAPTPERAPQAVPPPQPAGNTAPTSPSGGPPTALIAFAVFVGIVVIGGGVLWALS